MRKKEEKKVTRKYINNDFDPIYDEGMELANAGKYQAAIDVLSTIPDKNNHDLINNIGVCYERLKCFETAADYYHRSKITLAKVNLLKLYHSKKIDINVRDYKDTCRTLIRRKSSSGYYYLSLLYDSIGDHKAAMEIANLGCKACPRQSDIIFQLAWLKIEYGKTPTELEEGHALYGSLLCREDKEKFYMTARHNYAYQCQKGIGCQKDVEKAIFWYEKAYEAGYEDAAQDLINIYTNEVGFVNRDKARHWERIKTHWYDDWDVK